MIERIVVGVARVDTAQKAAKYGIDLATKVGAELHLVTAYSAKDASWTDREQQHAEGFLESIALAAAIPMRTHALPGDPAEAILRVANEVDADLIVVGNKGMQGAARILGSVPNSIARKTACSILIVSTT
jgi:nucleotide-binding universal stress UspA family protein